MNIKEVTEQSIWDQYLTQFPRVSFLESWTWGQFQRQKGAMPLYWQLEKNGQRVGASLLLQMPSKRGMYLECMGGPIFESNYQEMFAEWLVLVHQKAKELRAMFLRLRLPFEDDPTVSTQLQEQGFRPTTLYYQAEWTRIISLDGDEETILQRMKKKTRYEIRRTLKENVTVEQYRKETVDLESEIIKQAFGQFLDLYHMMVQRQGYVGYTDDYLWQQFKLFFHNNQAELLLAKQNNRYLAGAIFLDYGDTRSYLHAASIPDTKISPPSLILWEAIRLAKKRGKQWLDLFGIATPGRRYVSRVGLSNFKEGFGGEEVHWSRTHDFVYQKFPYLFNRIIELLPNNIRRFGALFVPKRS